MSEFLIYFFLFTSVLVTGLTTLLLKIELSKNLRSFISFSGAFLLALCVLHLIPEIFIGYTTKIGLFVLVGFLLQLILEFFSNGIEHGHFHSHNKKLATFPYAIFISLCIHSFIEGMALIDDNQEYNDSLLLGIIIHKLPITIVLSTMLMSKKLSRIVLSISLIIFSISAPLGLYLGSNYLVHAAGESKILLALAVGIFLHISTTILFESTANHKFDLRKFVITVLGFIVAFLTL